MPINQTINLAWSYMSLYFLLKYTHLYIVPYVTPVILWPITIIQWGYFNNIRPLFKQTFSHLTQTCTISHLPLRLNDALWRKQSYFWCPIRYAMTKFSKLLLKSTDSNCFMFIYCQSSLLFLLYVISKILF